MATPQTPGPASETSPTEPLPRVQRRTAPSPRRIGAHSSHERLAAMIGRLDRESGPPGSGEEGPEARGPRAAGSSRWLRFAPSRRAVTGLLLFGAVAVLGAMLFFPRGATSHEEVGVMVSGSVSPLSLAPDPGGVPEGSGTQAPTEVAVHVTGAVKRPGLVRLPPGALVADALDAVGGSTQEASLDAVNLASPVQNGQQIRVPTEQEAVASPPVQAPGPSAPGLGPAEKGRSGAAASGTSPGEGTAPGNLINLNTASAEELESLPRVGPVLSQKIIDYREAQGGFTSVDELDAVPGIGEAMMAALEPLVTV